MSETYHIIGVDLEPGSSPKHEDGGKYTVYLYNLSVKGKHVLEHITRTELLQLVRRLKPNYLATDNLMELAATKHALVQFLAKLPLQTKVVQVTSQGQGRFLSLKELIRKANLGIHGKPDPVETAKACAVLVTKGYGRIINPFENELIIKVSRPRAKGAGGWSQARYQRSLDEIVMQATRAIEVDLNEQGLEYDVHKIKGNHGGLKQAIFHVYLQTEYDSPRIHPKKYFPARISLSRPTKPSFTYVPLPNQRQTRFLNYPRRVIVGIDPGLTIGISILDLRGKIIHVTSIKGATRAQVISEIVKHGIPTIVCSDVAPMPKFVEKIAAIMDALKVEPRNELSQIEKRNLASGYKFKNAHEMDSLAAAINGFKMYRRTIEKVFQSVPSQLKLYQKELVVTLVLKGMTLGEAIHGVTPERMLITPGGKEQEPSVPKPELNVSWDNHIKVLRRVSKLEQRIADIIKLNNELEEQLEEERAMTKYLEKEIQRRDEITIRKVMTNEELRKKQEHINALREENERYTRMVKDLQASIKRLNEMIWLRNYHNAIPVRVIKKFTSPAILRAEKEYVIQEHEVILFLDPTGGGTQTAQELIRLNPKLILWERGRFPDQAEELLRRRGMLLMESPKEGLLRYGENAIILRETLERLLEKAREEQQEYEKQAFESKFYTLLKNYRESRKDIVLSQGFDVEEPVLDDEEGDDAWQQAG